MTLPRPSPALLAPRDPGRGQRSHVALRAGGATAAGGLALLAAGSSPALRVLTALALVVLLPTAQRLDRRVLVNLAVSAPALAGLAWMPGPARLLPVVGCVAVGYVAWRASRTGFRAVLPTAHLTDALLVLVPALAVVLARPLVGRTPQQALAMLLHGWDHASHADMYLAHRTGASLADASASGSWYFDAYPQLFHAHLAGLAELFWGDVGSLGTEVSRYATLQVVYLAWAAALGTAALLQADAVRTSSSARAAAAGVFGAGLLLGFPGAVYLMAAHVNFVASAVAAAAVLLLLADGHRNHATVGETVTAASLLMVVGSWPLLLPLVAVPAVRFLRSCLVSPRRDVRLAAVVSAMLTTAVVSGLCLVCLRIDVAAHLTDPGGLLSPGAVATIVLLVGLLAVAAPRRQRTEWPCHLWWPALCGVVLLGGVAAIQISTSGTVSYYLWKIAVGTETILLLGATPWVARTLVDLGRAAATQLTIARRLARLGAALFLALPAIGLFGATSAAPSPTQTTASLSTWDKDEGPAAELLTAAADRSLSPASTTLVVVREGSFSPALLNSWYHSLTRTRTVSEEGRLDELEGLRRGATRDDVLRCVAVILSTTPNDVLVVDPQLHAALVAALPRHRARLRLLAGAEAQ